MTAGMSLLERLDAMSLAKGTRHKIIVGIDYGTTFSGISYVTTDKSGVEDIKIISIWPGELRGTWKTPTRIAYKRENRNIQSNKWGFEVDPKLISYSWTKLLLDKNAVAGEYDDPSLSYMSGQGIMQLPNFRDAAGVCEDFLHEIYLYISLKLRQQMSNSTFDKTPMECWITLPAIWSEEAKDSTLKAARNAGFGNRPGDAIYTIAEPEAAAIATLKSYSGSNTFNPVKPNEHILICDCGGGTVDITTYTITRVEPQLDFDELCVGVGGKCGSTYIDRNLHSLLSKRFGRTFDNLPVTKKGPGSRFMTCFEKLKQDFGLTDNRDDRELSPLNLNIPDSEYYDGEESIVKLTYEDMESLFDPVVLEITNLVGQQVKEVKEKKGASIDRIILVGGFGSSAYLNKALTEWCLDNGNIKLLCPEDPQAAVVRGAALRGLEGGGPRMKHARRHYGISVGMPFREDKDPETKAYTEKFEDMKYCMGRMEWLISKGDKIFEDTVRSSDCTFIYRAGEAWDSRLMLYSCALNDPPEYDDNPRVELVGKIVSHFDEDFDYGSSTEKKFNTRLGKFVTRLPHRVEVRFGDRGENLKFRTLVDGKATASTVIEFDRH